MASAQNRQRSLTFLKSAPVSNDRAMDSRVTRLPHVLTPVLRSSFFHICGSNVSTFLQARQSKAGLRRTDGSWTWRSDPAASRFQASGMLSFASLLTSSASPASSAAIDLVPTRARSRNTSKMSLVLRFVFVVAVKLLLLRFGASIFNWCIFCRSAHARAFKPRALFANGATFFGLMWTA